MSTAAKRADIRLVGQLPPFHAEHRPDQLAARFEGRETTYAEFDLRTNRIANRLAADGLSRGDRVAYLGKNSDEYFELFFACAKAGVVLIPIGWRLAGPEIEYIAADCDAAIMFVGPELVEKAISIHSSCPGIRTLIAMETGVSGLTGFSDWYSGAGDGAPDIALTPASPLLQLYTSGTTGRPKGAVLSHANFTEGRARMSEHDMTWNEWTDDDVSLVAMPCSHIGGTGWGFMGYHAGALNVIAREFIPSAVLDFIERDGISKLFMVPAAIQFVLADPRAQSVDYSRLNYILYGASPIPLDLLRRAIEVFQCGFCQQYGMTETTGTIVYLPPEDHDVEGNQRMRGAGKPFPWVSLRVRGSDGDIVGPGVIGEVETRSCHNMLGYWKLDNATRETIADDGWLKTGDAGYLDEDGYLYIQDRVKDMICSGAENIYPAEVESAVYGHPDIAEVAVIGVPDDQWGEAVKAIVVAKPGTSPAAADIIAFARTRIAAFKAPKSVDFIDALPRNPSGKILRKDLRAPFWKGRDRAVN
ncbi:fatty acid--CoA ligase [Pacificimonas sp. WHA3]|uniref:Fatty acid--CoA ligase n=1 Tax=Pacificimonas pallii TaxID=2827236 RepID=A0ABS6SH89_9SPHN|nr:fatty acid--CoA ligase [Pacificimonas pallii]MBV7257276.1 fatty acid--CoA ligase [Pacificimonas pallii]